MSKFNDRYLKKKRISRGVKILAAGFTIFLVLFLLITGGGWILHIIFSFLLGWFSFIFSNLKNIEFNWELLACGIVALALGTYGVHRITLWIRNDKSWHWKWTLSLVSLTLFLFAASIAMTGIIHQTVWLVKSPILESYRNGRTKAIGHQKQLLIRLVEYQSEHGRYPQSLEQLKTLSAYPDFPEVLLYDQTIEGWEPWVYFGSYHNTNPEGIAVRTLPLIMSPRPHGEHFVALISDGSVISLTKDKLLEKFPMLIDLIPHLLE